MINKILLVWPYNETEINEDDRTDYNLLSLRFPLGIGYLAAYIERELGINVEILDLVAESPEPKKIGNVIRWGMTDLDIESRIREINPDMVGVSQMFSYLDPVCRKLFAQVKNINSDIVTVWGGTHPTVMPDECIKCKDVDYLVLGEGEVALKELVSALNSGADISGLRSLAYEDSGGMPVVNNNRSWIDDLDAHVLPARNKVDMNKYLGEMKRANLISSRGCPFACTFCTAPTMYQKRYNTRSPEKVVDEIELLKNEYGAVDFILQDENTTFDMDRIEGFADEIIKRGLKISWYSEVGVLIARLNDGLIKKLALSGCSELRLPMESGDPEVLKKMKKPLKLTKVAKVVKSAREAGLRVVSFLLMGLPGETEQSMRMTADLAEEIGFDWNVISMVLPLPGTQIYEDLSDRGIKFDYEDYIRYTLPVEGVSTIPSEKLIALREEMNNRINFAQNYNLTRGDIDIAIDRFEDLSVQYPNLPKMHYYLGLAKYTKGEINGSLRSFERSLDLDNSYKNSSEWVRELRNLIESNGQENSNYLPESVENSLNYTYRRDTMPGCLAQKVG